MPKLRARQYILGSRASLRSSRAVRTFLPRALFWRPGNTEAARAALIRGRANRTRHRDPTDASVCVLQRFLFCIVSMFDTDRQTDQTETGRKPRGDITTCATFDTQRYILRRKRALSQLVALLQLLDEGPQPVVGRELYLSYVRGLLVKRRVGLGC